MCMQIRQAWKRGHARFVIIPTTWLHLHHIEPKLAVLGFRFLWFTVMVDFFPAETLKIHTNAHAVRGRPTPKDVERQFRNGSFHELKSRNNSNSSDEERDRKNNTRNNMDAIFDAFKTTFYSTFAQRRSLGLAVISRISFICIILFLFTILNSFLNSLSFVQIAVPSVLMTVFCIVLVVRYFTISTTINLINSSENDCNVFEGGEQLSVFIHHNKESCLVQEYRSRSKIL